MIKAGQKTITGISDQADITLLYLLKASKQKDFQGVVIEGEYCEDFILIFKDRKEIFEVKSWKRSLSYSQVKQIIQRALKRNLSANDRFILVVRKISNEFRKYFEYIYEYLPWILISNYRKNPVINKFFKKGWNLNELKFLTKTELIEFTNIESQHKQISEFFALDDPYYLNSQDQQNIISQLFKEILRKGKKGHSIGIKEFNMILDKFKKNIIEKSESFSPELSIGKKVINLEKFFSSETKLEKLDDHKYLTPISANPRLIFYIERRLEDCDFNLDSFSFFIDKVLLKQNYILLLMKLLSLKYEQGKINQNYYIDFLIGNYKKISKALIINKPLKILKDLLEENIEDKYLNKVLEFLKGEFLKPFRGRWKDVLRPTELGRNEDKYIAEIMKIYFDRAKDKDEVINFVFKYFNFTSDDYNYLQETHKIIYSSIKDYIEFDYINRFSQVIYRISRQFNMLYNNRYDGYEWVGSGISQTGSSYSITDKGIVRFIFRPLFLDIYGENPSRAWGFFKEKILNLKPTSHSKGNPVYLKRALIPIILERLADDKLSEIQKKESFKYIKNILKIKKGFPNTSETIFNNLKSKNLEKIGFRRVMKLIEIDSYKYKGLNIPAGYPTNIFVIDVLFKLIKSGYDPAKEFFHSLIKKPEFIRRDEWYDSFELLSSRKIVENESAFISSVLNKINLNKYINKLSRFDVWDKSKLLADLIIHDWKKDTQLGIKIIHKLMKPVKINKLILEFLGGCIHELTKSDSLKTYSLLKPYLLEKTEFRKKFKNNAFFRQQIVHLGEDLAQKEEYNKAKVIVNLCLDDPDPVTSNEDKAFNYHLQVKRGGDVGTIHTVRGSVPWVLQKFVFSNQPKDLKYAFDKTKILLDLNGSFARRLGYPEPDLYIRLQALVTLIELAHPARRKLLNEYKSGLGNKVKALSFKILTTTNNLIQEKKATPKMITEDLVHIFSYIRDLDTNDANLILDFFEKENVEKAYFLFIFFAEFRPEYYKEIPFNSIPFKERLIRLCMSNSIFNPSFAFEFYRIAEDNKKKFNKIEKSWKVLFETYRRDVFDHLYRTLNITLKWKDKYNEHKELLKKALKKETDYYRDKKDSVHIWNIYFRDVFQTLKEHSLIDFLEMFSFLLENITENVHYFEMKYLIDIFNSIKPEGERMKKMWSSIELRLKDIYPENFL